MPCAIIDVNRGRAPIRTIIGSIAVSVGIIAAGSFASWYLAVSKSLDLDDADLVSSIIAIAASVGALVSATFVIFSYLQTNRAFIEAQRPQLLILLDNKYEHETNLPVSFIHYHNITQNKFDDLKIIVEVTINGEKHSLDHLFRSSMTMIGQDRRQRKFKPYDELANVGVDMPAQESLGNKIELDITYEYIFYRKLDRVHAQKYEWDGKSKRWEIC
ncbi:hypothetical protein [Halomonas ramblicola]|uniref:hypothetical protein n=1 Tax=Halomonas ramblicola TaxID=747349 RepID=UPI0025B621F5|nr:hypothetical protein [Halomonas ramblicola]MDN3520181.1 hypothetical protein [Halomonas ramblicola]